jgi:hypothetical protein
MRALHVLRHQVHLAFVLALGQRHVQWLGADDTIVHLSDRLGGLLGRREAHETKALAAAASIGHHFGRRN